MKTRLLSKTPPFWKGVQKIGLVAAAGGAFLMSANSISPQVPTYCFTIGMLMSVVGGAIAAMSQAAKEGE